MKSCPEETKINCCGTFNYQSNSKLENNCLETYRYDHSIYFKTIGDIRSDKRDVIRDLEQDRVSISSEELVEWDASSLVDLNIKPISEETCNNNCPDEPNVSDTIAEQEQKGTMQNVWPIVNLKLNLDLMDNRKKKLPYLFDRDNLEINEKQRENNNVNSPENKADEEDQENKTKNYEKMEKFPSFRKIRQSSIRKSLIVDENNVIWPGVLNYKILNYNNNFDVADISLQD